MKTLSVVMPISRRDGISAAMSCIQPGDVHVEGIIDGGLLGLLACQASTDCASAGEILNGTKSITVVVPPKAAAL